VKSAASSERQPEVAGNGRKDQKSEGGEGESRQRERRENGKKEEAH